MFHHREPLPEYSPKQLTLFNSEYIIEVNGTGHNEWSGITKLFQMDLSKVQNRIVAVFVGENMRRSDRCVLRDAFVLAHALIESSYPAPTGTAQKLHGLLVHFERDLQAHGLEFVDELSADHVQQYMWSAQKTEFGYTRVSPRTAANRQWAIRQFLNGLATEGFCAGSDLTGVTVSRGEAESSRPMTAREIERLQSIVSGTLISIGDDVLVALSLAGGDASEVGQVRLRDINLSSQTVTFRGEAERTALLDNWACERICLFLEDNHRLSVQRVAVTDFVDDLSVARTVTTRLMNVMRMSGIRSNTAVTAKSLRREVKGWWKYAYTTGSLNKVVVKVKLENKRISTQKR